MTSIVGCPFAVQDDLLRCTPSSLRWRQPVRGVVLLNAGFPVLHPYAPPSRQKRERRGPKLHIAPIDGPFPIAIFSRTNFTFAGIALDSVTGEIGLFGY